MQIRRDIWKKLKSETQGFVIDYLTNNLKLKETEHENFLFPDYEKNLLNAKSMHGLEKAVQRIIEAIRKEEMICVYGDYDCDGVPGTALLRDFFEKIGYANVTYYIPHRHTEGYGLNIPAIEKLDSENVKLIITIDLGTTNVEEIEAANKLGIDTIVTDHHLPIEDENGQILPKAYAIINNKQVNCNYANKDLCGSGTIFKLVVEILSKLKNISDTQKSEWKHFEKIGIKLPAAGYEKWLLDLVAIATIADMVPLREENRVLTIYGLYVLSKTNRAGLQTLFQNAKTNLKNVTETDIAFTVAPRINSASRMANPRIALSMFSQNLKEGIDAAHELEELNTNRKETTKNITKKIYKILDERIENSTDKKLPEVLVIGSNEWNAGVLGILASKILDRYNVNVFVWGENLKGSCRSRGDIHLVKLMTEVKEKLIHFGGHELAGGFSVAFENVHTLEDELNKNIEAARIENLVQQKKDDSKTNVIKINLSGVNSDLLNALNLIGPFGVGNPKPIFAIDNVLETEIIRFGKSKEHLKINLIGKNLQDMKMKIEAIKFFVEKSEEENILDLYKKGSLFYEIEPGWNSPTPRLKIIV